MLHSLKWRHLVREYVFRAFDSYCQMLSRKVELIYTPSAVCECPCNGALANNEFFFLTLSIL